MSHEGMTQLTDDVKEIVNGAQGDPSVAMTVLGQEFRRNPARIFGVWEELGALGARDTHRVQVTVEWAQGVVNECLQSLRLRADARWPDLPFVSQGLCDVLTMEVQNFRHR
jgi:hypothetical protein